MSFNFSSKARTVTSSLKPTQLTTSIYSSQLAPSSATTPTSSMNTSFDIVSQESDASRALILKNAGNSLAESGKFVRALEKWNAALVLTPLDPILHELKAQALLEMYQYDEALTNCQLALKYAPHWIDGLVTLGRIYWRLGQLERANSALNSALESLQHATKVEKSGENTNNLQLEFSGNTATTGLALSGYTAVQAGNTEDQLLYSYSTTADITELMSNLREAMVDCTDSDSSL